MAARIKIVWPSGSGYRARLQRFYAYSAIFHVVVVVFLVFAPRLFGSSRPNFSDEFLDAMRARLVADVAEEPVKPAAQPVVEPEPDPPKPKPPPEEIEAAGDVVHDKQAEPTPKKEDPKPPPPRSDPEPVEEPDDDGSTERVGDSSAGVQAGGEISLADDWYRSAVSRALYSTWRKPPLAGLRQPLSVVVGFEIRKDGTVTDLRVIESSGVDALDRTALRAAAEASPLPKHPPTWRGSSMTVECLFELTPEDF